MHKNIEEILLDNIKLHQYRRTWKQLCRLLNHLVGLPCLSKRDRDTMEAYWHMLFIRIGGENHMKRIKFHERYARSAASKIIASKEGCNDN